MGCYDIQGCWFSRPLSANNFAALVQWTAAELKHAMSTGGNDSRCGIYPFHQTLRKPGHYRLNLGCVEGLDSSSLPFDLFDGASL